MIKRVLLFTAVSGMISLTLSSYEDGPARHGLNRTGSAGSPANCSGAGCHSANTANTTVGVLVLDGGTAVTQYTGGKTYTVQVAGSNNTASLPEFGFQVSAVSGASNSTQAGTFDVTSATGIAKRSVGSISIVEHTAPIAGTGTGTSWAYLKSFSWTAPAAGTGTVKFYLTLNAVNGNGSESGDQPNAGTLTLTEAPTSVHEVTNNIEVKAYPNPTSNLLHISMENAAAGKYAVEAFDMSGKKLLNETINVTGATSETTVSMQNWPAGMYHVVISKDGNKKVVPVVKQ